MNVLDAIFLGVVEGITEFLPISSTGHLILASELLHLDRTAFLSTFEVVIQMGAILAVVILYIRRFLVDWELNKRLIVGVIPALVVGGIFYPFIKHLLDSPLVVVVSLLTGGVFIIGFEWLQEKKEKPITDLNQISYRTAFLVGLWQATAVIPGISRAAATILGGLLLGMRRTVIVEFSFLLAVPTMIAASTIDLYKNASAFTPAEFKLLAIGFLVACLVAMGAIKLFLRFVQSHTFIPFGIYRILIALLFLFFVIH